MLQDANFLKILENYLKYFSENRVGLEVNWEVKNKYLTYLHGQKQGTLMQLEGISLL